MVTNVKDINHAQFADDTLLLGGASVLSARNFKQELDRYKEVSGSKTNYKKAKSMAGIAHQERCWKSPEL
jgi:hypothetical protein